MLNNGIEILSDYEKGEVAYGEKGLENLKEIKSLFFDLMSKVREHSNATQPDYEDAVICMEQTLDDLIHKDWSSAREYARSYEEIPKSRFLKSWEIEKAKGIVARQNTMASEARYGDVLEALG